MANQTMNVTKIHPNAKTPERKTAGSAGYDLTTVEDVVLPAHQSVLISTGVKIELPKRTYGQIAPRSGLSVKGIDVGAGIIDEDYRGEIKVLLRNHSDDDIELPRESRIAQLLVLPVCYPDLNLVDPEALESTERGAGGFGSTGV
jgi:dUTP pyrophosphatase